MNSASIAVWFALALSGAAQDPGAELQRLLGALDTARGARVDELGAELAKLGAAAGAAALAPASQSFAELPLEARRARSALARELSGVESLAAALAALDDPDGIVRANLCALLGAPRMRAERAQERAAALERAVRDWPEASERAEAVRALAQFDHPAAAEALARLIAEVAGAEQVALASALAAHPRSRDTLVELVERAARGAGPALGAPALAELCAAFGTALAELPAGGDSPADRAVFLMGARHPDERVRAAATVALERFVARALVLGENARAERLLAGLSGGGLDDHALAVRRVELALAREDGAAAALDLAREIVRREAPSNDPRTRVRRATGQLLVTAALFVLGRGPEAEPLLADAQSALAALRAERWDLRGRDDRPDLDPRELEQQLLAALVPTWRAVIALRAGAQPDSLAVLELARAADVALLEAQLEVSRSYWSVTLSHDELFTHPLGPTELVLGGSALRGRELELEHLLYRAFASVAGGGLPGFAPFEGLEPAYSDPLRDARRRALLQRVQSARHESAQAQLDREFERLDRAELARDPTQLAELDYLRARMRQKFQEELAEGDAALLRLRGVSRAALSFAERNREQGRAESARRLAERARADLESARGTLDELTLARYLAASESALGGALMDLERASEAEAVLLRALERLDGAARELEGRDDPAGVRAVRAQRAGMLTSLAVNANVKLREPAKAVGYFERAFELDQSDFMRVLLACYRARAGRAEEARALLEGLRVAPGNFYNLACTWALLGERELALDYLARDFAELRTSPGSRERQKSWAASDPDLESLRGDPRFAALVKLEPAVERGK